MIKFYTKLLLCAVPALLLLSTYNAKAQQTFSYTQYMNDLTPLNPAYSLLDKAGSVNTLLSKRFLGINGAPTTFLFDANLPIEPIDGAAGLIVKNDAIAVESLTEINAYFAKAVQLTDKDFLSVSISGGFSKYVANYSSLAPDDPEFNQNDVRQTEPNLGFGVMLYSDNYYIGLSVPDLSVRNLGVASYQPAGNYFRNNYYLSGAILDSLSDEVKWKPAALVAYSRGVPVLASISATIYLQNILGIGASYRSDKQFAGILTYAFDQFRFGYSYQVGTSSNNLGAVNAATHEVTLSYRFGPGSANPKGL
jgi:type IX secretion system PorP/SprF family membrane protein